MFDPLLILFVLTIVVHDGVHGLPAGEVFSVAITVSVVLGGIVAIVGGAYGFTAIRLHQYDRAPTQKYARSVLRIQSIAKLLLAAHWLVVVLWLGWLQETREYLGGNLVLIDEGLAVAPFLVGLMVLYGVPHGLRQRYREAMLTRMLDQGEPIPPQIGLLHAIWETARLKMGTVLVPVIVLITASESIDRLIVRLRLRRPQWGEGDWPEIVGGGAQFAAVISVLICMPLALRWIWRTSRLPAGEVRDRLVRMCREQSVRVRDILVWHTDHATLNGAMVGVLPRVRYIMLTDALIERLPTEQLEAVMAHEIAHAKHHHLPWMIAAVGSVVAICSSGLWLAARPILMRMDDHRQFVHWSDITSLAVLVVALAVAILFFGYMSRRFERQADSFAAQHLSGMRLGREYHPPHDRCLLISPQSVFAMQSALETVGLSSGVPTDRFSFRHDSIRNRQHALGQIVLKPTHDLPIDSTVRRMKLLTFGLLALAVILMAVQIEVEREDRASAHHEVVGGWIDENLVLRRITPSEDRNP